MFEKTHSFNLPVAFSFGLLFFHCFALSYLALRFSETHPTVETHAEVPPHKEACRWRHVYKAHDLKAHATKSTVSSDSWVKSERVCEQLVPDQ